MIVSMYTSERKVLTFELFLYGYGYLLGDILFINKNAPTEIVTASPENRKAALKKWLNKRVIPRDRPDFDDIVLKKLHYPKWKFGRAYGMEYTLATLSNWKSPHDDFEIYPEKDETICFVHTCPELNNMYFWKKKSD